MRSAGRNRVTLHGPHHGGLGVLAAALAVAGVGALLVWRGVVVGNAELATFGFLIPGPLAVLGIIDALRRDPRVLVDDLGVRDVRQKLSIRWDEVSSVHLNEGRRGRYHGLVFALNDGSGKAEVPIDQLSRPWREIVALVERRAGIPISGDRASIEYAER